ncbi:MAG: aminotransferase class V-fold PLP-dependent enzyme [Hyphomicrobiaceae bacterium]|nr:aminotransferase class V-fold PLP-dependent enzyme [Hyphomicrobiaceae bacterium]
MRFLVGRRALLQSAAATALFGIPLHQAKRALACDAGLPSCDLYKTDPERYWSLLRRLWLLAPDRINLNCGALGCTPIPVLRATVEHLLFAEEYREPDNPWFGYAENARIRATREALARYLNCKLDELALTRNATEGNNVIANGLDIPLGDEVLLTDQEHPGARCAWEQKAARFGIKINVIKLPRPPASNEEMVKLFEDALTERTRVILFSHITWQTGLVLPAKEICALANRRGILTHVDGAHGPGQIKVDLADLGCDFYASNGHKWLMAPKGSGMLFVREPHLERLWAHTVAEDWRNYGLKAYRFSNVGTSNLSVIVGFKAALDFVNAIGREHIYARIHEQARKVRDGLRQLPQIRMLNASTDAHHAGLVSFTTAKGDLGRVAAECDQRRIRIRYWPDEARIRVSTHVFTHDPEINAFLDAVARGLRG